MRKIFEIRDEIGVYNKTLNNYIRTFNLKIFNKEYLEDWNIVELRDYHFAKPKLTEFLYSRKNQIIEFESDYYKWKSPSEIADKIEINVDKIILLFKSKHIAYRNFPREFELRERNGFLY